jgi:hypothetical protein
VAIDYNFTERLGWSERYTTTATVNGVLMEYIPGALRVTKAVESDDRNGTDWWVYRSCDRTLSIDAKVRSEDWAARPEPQDDLALETWSVVERNVPGWTRNERKRTDYILWLWTDSGRSCLVPFPMLCAVFMANWMEWRKQYKIAQQYTPDREYHSECVFVPRRVIWQAIYKRFGGSTGGTK